MKVGMVAAYRYHFFEAARELKKRGLLGRLATGYSRRVAEGESLDPAEVAPFPFLTGLHLALVRLNAPQKLLEELHWQAQDRLDRWAASRFDDCQVVMAMEGSGLHSGRAARRRGAKFVLDRPVIHIQSQDELLREAYTKNGLPYHPIHPKKIEKQVQEYAEADLILTPSRLAARSFVERGIPESKVAILPLGADVSRFRPSEGARSQDLELCFAGNVSVQKGIYVLAEAVEKLHPMPLKVVVAGHAGPEAQGALERLAKACQLEATGKVSQDQLQKLMSRATAFVLPSVQDGFGMVAPQAMACGTPCIISDMAGASEMVEDGVDGLVFRSGDSGHLADKIRWVRDCPEEAAEMGRKGREAVARVQGWGAYGDELARILARLAGEPQGALSR